MNRYADRDTGSGTGAEEGAPPASQRLEAQRESLLERYLFLRALVERNFGLDGYHARRWGDGQSRASEIDESGAHGDGPCVPQHRGPRAGELGANWIKRPAPASYTRGGCAVLPLVSCGFVYAGFADALSSVLFTEDGVLLPAPKDVRP